MTRPTSSFKFYLLLFFLLNTLYLSAKTNEADFGEFIRYTPTPGILETSVIKFSNSKGQSVDLISAVHVGSISYYRELNEEFSKHDALLYELIIPEELKGRQLPSNLDSDSGVSGLQGMLARSMGLATQMSRIDYTAENFVHADLTTEGLQEKMAERQESLIGYLMQNMLNADTSSQRDIGVSDQEFAQLNLMAVLSGTGTKRDKSILRKVFGSTLASSGGVLSSMGKTAIISERNEAAMTVLHEQIHQGNQNLAIFYGAAHMPDLRRRLLKDGWIQGESKWLRVWGS